MTTHRILVLNGPNLNLLGTREPHIYGSATLADIESSLQAAAAGWHDVQVVCKQSNVEGAMIDWLHAQAAGASGLIVNAGAYAHTSIALRDAIAATAIPAVEVHLSNIFAREAFRQQSLLAGVCLGSISGLGAFGYEAALECLLQRAGAKRTRR